MLANALYLVSFDSGATIGPVIASGFAAVWGIRAALAMPAIPFLLNIPVIVRKKRARP